MTNSENIPSTGVILENPLQNFDSIPSKSPSRSRDFPAKFDPAWGTLAGWPRWEKKRSKNQETCGTWRCARTCAPGDFQTWPSRNQLTGFSTTTSYKVMHLTGRNHDCTVKIVDVNLLSICFGDLYNSGKKSYKRWWMQQPSTIFDISNGGFLKWWYPQIIQNYMVTWRSPILR